MSNAYNYQPQAAPPQKSGGALKVILIVLGVLLVLCCGGFAIMGYLGYSAFNMGMAEVAKQAIANSPDAQAEIGDVQSASMNMEAMQKNGGMVFDVKGSKASGQIVVSKDGQSAELKLPDGRSIPLHMPEGGTSGVKMPDLHSTTDTDTTTGDDSEKEAEAPAPAP